MPDVNRGDRPLSPFMIGQYYKPQLTSISSIMVRITGIALLAFAILIVWWLLAAATSQGAFAFIDGILRSFIGDILMLGATWALFYHTLGRLRHVIWDFGHGLEVETSELMAKGMFGLATILTVLVAILGLGGVL
ncbi:MAG: succinate dehydrogenase, cytochrome b556 subunit [Pseudomonadota bacterium]